MGGGHLSARTSREAAMSLPRTLLLSAACLSATAIAAPVPVPKGDGRELHVVCLYEGSTRTGDTIHGGKAAVRVDRPGKLVTLVVGAYNPISWDVTVTEKTRLAKVVLAGYHQQAVNEQPKHIEVVEAFAEGRQGLTALRTTYRNDSAEFRRMLRQIHDLTGQEVASFHGASRGDHQRPIVIDRTQDDPRLRSDYPRPEPAAELPKLAFQALHFVAGQFPPLPQASYGTFALTSGPDFNSLRPLPGRVNRLTVDPATKKGYALAGHDVVEIDLQNNAMTKLNPGLQVPRISWPCGITFDTKRNRVLVATFGGTGFLYAFTPADGKWSVLSELNNIDPYGLVYHPKEDALFGLGAERGENGNDGMPVLRRYNDKGALVSQKRLTGPGVIPGLATEGPVDVPAQLVPADDSLVLLATVNPERGRAMPNAQSESFIYLVDPKSAKARLAWKQ
jgi:hypothetical protein